MEPFILCWECPLCRVVMRYLHFSTQGEVDWFGGEMVAKMNRAGLIAWHRSGHTPKRLTIPADPSPAVTPEREERAVTALRGARQEAREP